MQLNNIPTGGTNALLILNHQVAEQKQSFSKDNLTDYLGGSNATQSAEQEMINYQIQQFIKFIQDPRRKSLNRYNDPKVLLETLAGAKVVKYDTFCHLNGVRFIKGLAEGRGSGVGDQWKVIEKFHTLFACIGYLEQFPIIFDRNYCIIDGYQRYLAASKFKTMDIPYIMYDIDLMSECSKEEQRRKDRYEDLDW